MSVLCNASDIHLVSSASNGFTNSTDPHSITCWINATWNPGSRKSLVGMYAFGSSSAVQIGTSTGNNDLSCWTWGGTSLVTTATGFMTAYNGVWVHITYTFDGTTHLLYLNGTQVASGTTAQTSAQYNEIYINGYPSGTTSEVSNHSVSYYAYFNRTLSANEVLTMTTERGARHGIRKGLIAEFHFDDKANGTTVSTIPDLSGNGNSLAITGAGTAMTYTYSTEPCSSHLRMIL